MFISSAFFQKYEQFVDKSAKVLMAETVALTSDPMFVDWLVGCFGSNGPLRQYFSLYRAVSQREGERGEEG